MRVIGIDIGAPIKAGMVNEEGTILAARTTPMPAALDTFLPSLHKAVRGLLEATAFCRRADNAARVALAGEMTS